MSHLVYSDTEPKTAFSGSLGNINPNRAWKNHLENWYFLKLTYMNGSFLDQHKASKELVICERKMEFWERRASFNHDIAREDIATTKRKWEASHEPKLT